jgi:hypothetical protein
MGTLLLALSYMKKQAQEFLAARTASKTSKLRRTIEGHQA